MRLFGFFSPRLFLAWTAIALVAAPPFAILVWPARQVGWRAAAASLPVGLLMYEACSLRWRLAVNDDYKILFAFYLLSAVALLLMFSKSRVQLARIVPVTFGIALAAQVFMEYVVPRAVGMVFSML